MKIATFLFFALSTYLISSEAAVIDGRLSATVSARVNLITSNPTAGSPLQVDCVTKGPPEAKVTWQFGVDQIIADERRRILSNHTLFITKADVSDSGEYRCTVRYNNNVASGSVYVRVKALSTNILSSKAVIDGRLPDQRGELSPSDTYQADKKKFKCPFPFGVFSDPDDCEYYQVCVADVSMRKKCRFLQHFDILRRTCLPILIAICGNDGNKNKTTTTGTTKRVTATTPSGDRFSCPSWTGNFPHPSDCSKYYSCIFYQASLKTCPKSELFDAVKKSCRSASKVHCGDRKRPDSTTTTDIVTASVTPTQSISTTRTPTETDAIITTSSPDEITITATEPSTSSSDSTPTEGKPTGPPETDCDEDDVDCIIDETGDPDDWFTCPQDIGAYVHPSSNKLFIFCMNWKPSVRKCGMDLIFSEELSTCVEIKYIL